MSKGFKQTEIGKIPDEWEIAALGDSLVSNLIMGQSPSSASYNSNGIGLPFFQGKADFGTKHPRVRQWCSEPIKIAETKDVLLSVRAPVGDVNISDTKCCIGRGLAAIRFNYPRMSHRFGYYYLQKQKTFIESFGTGTIFKSINKTSLSAIPVPLPPLPEQKKIATVLSKLQKAIEIQDNILKTLRDLKKSTMHRLFSYGLKGEKRKKTEIGLIPGGWEVKPFLDFIELHRGYDLPVQLRNEGSVPIIGSNGIVGYHNESKLKAPGVLTGRSGTIGLSFYVEQDYWALNTSLYVSDFKGNHPRYVHYYFQIFNWDKYSAGVSVPTMNRNLVHSVLIPIPPLPEQTEIANILQTIDHKIEVHEGKKASYQDLFKTMLNKLMTGTIRVNELDIDTSEVEAA